MLDAASRYGLFRSGCASNELLTNCLTRRLNRRRCDTGFVLSAAMTARMSGISPSIPAERRKRSHCRSMNCIDASSGVSKSNSGSGRVDCNVQRRLANECKRFLGKLLRLHVVAPEARIPEFEVDRVASSERDRSRRLAEVALDRIRKGLSARREVGWPIHKLCTRRDSAFRCRRRSRA